MDKSLGFRRLFLIALLVIAGVVVVWQLARPSLSPTIRNDDIASEPGLSIGAVARVGGQEILEADLAGIVGRYPNAEPTDLLAAEVRRRSVVQAAREAGYLSDPDVQRSIDDVLVARYLADELRPRLAQLEVEPAEIEQVLSQQPAPGEQRPARRAAILRQTITNESDRVAARARLEEARGQVHRINSSLPHFGLLAERYSDEPGSMRRGGVIGTVRPQRGEHDTIPPEVHQALWQLEDVGEISPVVETTDALYLVRFVDERTPDRASPNTQRLDIERRLLTQKRDELRQAFFAALRRQAKVLVHPDWQPQPSEPNPALPAVPPMPGGLSSESVSPQ